MRLLTGRGSFVDDLTLPGLVHAVIVRSPHAHARIGPIDTGAALAAPGVLAVLTGADYAADGLGAIPHNAGLMNPPDVAVRRRGELDPDPPFPAADRQGALCRRAGRDGRRQHRRPGERRGRAAPHCYDRCRRSHLPPTR